MKKIILWFILLSISILTVYATVTIAKDRKSQILPWQWILNWQYDSAHNEWDSYKAESRFSFVNGNSKWQDVLVKDNVTWLIWESTPSTIARNWEDSKAYCDNLEKWGYDDWRLPSIMELSTIADYSRYNPSVDTNYFSLDVWFYRSSTSTYSGPLSWSLYLRDWSVYWNSNDENHKSLCVR